MYEIRTDLALEAREKFEEDNVEIKGVVLEEKRAGKDMLISKVVIETENGAKSMGKPKGTYVTFEAPNMMEEDEEYHKEISVELARIIRELVPLEQKDMSLLVVGLGNREVTPDALGPNVVDQLFVTRHMIREFGTYALGEEHTNQISGIVPGVMAQTGMESLEIVQGVAKETKPDCIFVIDALAARSVKRLNRTIQITDAGINPGSGVGNHRNGINRESIGVPVIAIGVPTVVDAATIVSDTMSSLIGAMTQAEHLKRIGHSLNALEESEKHALFRELLSPSLNAMFVTPKDIDESIRQISLTLSEGLNLAFQKHGGMS